MATKLLFTVNDGTHGSELWVSDGSAGATSLLKDINAGTGSTTISDVIGLSAGRVIFAADDGTSGIDLWITDGTTANTSMLANVGTASAGQPGGPGPGTTFGSLALGNGRVVFHADDGASGDEVWVTNGTAAGTSLLMDIRSGTSGSNIQAFALVGSGLAVFDADDGTAGRELWVTDGTAAGTSLLADLRPGAGAGSPTAFAALGDGRVLFAADNGSQGSELWVTDGTAGGTSLLKDIRAGANSGAPTGITALGNGTAVFAANDGIAGTEIWITDGTTGGTSLLLDIRSGGNSLPKTFAAIATGKVVFQANDGSHGVEPWVTDGTAGGTSLLRELAASTADSMSSGQHFYALGGGRAVFQANDGTTGLELWVTDGTTAGTSLLVDLNSGSAGSNPTHLVALSGGRMLFNATTASNGDALWMTDGTASGTSMVADLAAAATLLGTGLLNSAATGSLTLSAATGTSTLSASHALADADGLGSITFHWQYWNGASWVEAATGSSWSANLSGTWLRVTASFTDTAGFSEAATGIRTALFGDAGGNTLGGGADANWLGGLAGDDNFILSGGSDWLDGGSGFDRIINAGLRHGFSLSTAGGLHLDTASGSSMLTGIEQILCVDGQVQFSGFGNAGAVLRLYGAALARQPDPIGLGDWTSALDRGTMSLVGAANGFVGSQEFLARFGNPDNAGFVTLLYQNVLGRAPDAEGLQNWINALAGGKSRGEVLVGFSESNEFKENTESYYSGGVFVVDPAAVDVLRVYWTVLDRLPDPVGLSNWIDAMHNGLSRKALVEGFIGSPEWQAVFGGLSNQQFVEMMYQTALDRASDPAGLANWTNGLNSGQMSRADVVMGFAFSQELSNTLSPLIFDGIPF